VNDGKARVVTIGDAGEWNQALLTAPQADLLQSWEWGEFKRRTGNWSPLRVAVQREGALVAGAQILMRRVVGARFLYAPRGPWWQDGEALKPLVRWLRRTQSLRAPLLRVDPAVTSASALLAAGFRSAPRQVQPKATIVVNLEPGPEQILADFNGQVRYNARLAERKGVVVVEGGAELVERFWRLLTATAERKGFIERPLMYFSQLVDVFGGAARVLLGEFEGQTVAGAIVVAFGRSAYYLYGASGGDRSVKPAELVQYRAMLWAKSTGATRYDMWGIPAHPTEDNPLHGVYRFKSGFGGREEVYVGGMDLPLVPLAPWAPGAAEVLALKARSLARGQGFRLVDHLA
jgi:lipid II:glycine glycyltransferase (peptidoglycan interpeptide bridge formation enzyme)